MNIDNLLSGGSRSSSIKGRTKKKRPSTAIAAAKAAATASTNNNTETNNDDDDDLLALALGSSGVQNADAYEASVLRDAECSSTPRLMLQSHSHSQQQQQQQLVFEFGFPPLAEMVPSRNVRADLPNIRTVLQQLRRKSNKNTASTLMTSRRDCLKEQMLLALLQSATGDPEMGVFPQQEAKQEWKRRKLYREGANDNDDDNNDIGNGSSAANPMDRRASGLQSIATAATESTNQKQHDNDNETNANAIDDTTPEGRLEGIKKGIPTQSKSTSKKKSVRFADDVKPGSATKPKSLLAKKVVKIKPKAAIRRRRVSIQERRRRQLEGGIDGADDDVDADKNDGEDEKDLKERIVAQLKQIRIEREERRKRRKRAWRDNNDNDNGNGNDNGNAGEEDSNDDDDDDDDDNVDGEREFEFTGDDQTNNPQQPLDGTEDPAPGATIAGAIDVAVAVAVGVGVGSSVSAPTHVPSERVVDQNGSVVLCPLCNEEVPVPIISPGANEHGGDQEQKGNADSILAQHMAVCQTKPKTRRKRTARTTTATTRTSSSTTTRMTRATTTPQPRPRPNYADIDASDQDESDHDHDDYIEDNNNNHENQDKNEHELMDDDVVMDEDDNDPAVNTKSTKKSSTTKRKRSKRKVSRKPRAGKSSSSSSSSTPPLDDWYVTDYEDRVDDWIEHGLSKMPVMKEQDANEIPPGEEECEGGLILPAWVNDRLFPYQRTGLRWMWELHRQQSGGILGDEMGLGKTIQVSSFLGSMAASRKLKSILIISPATMLQHWLKEMAKWAPGVRRMLIHQSGDTPMPSSQYQGLLYNNTGQRKITTKKLKEASRWLKESRLDRLYEIIDEDDLDTRDPSTFCGTAYAFVTTFENVRRNEEIWTNHDWSYVVIDEAQKIRNPTADITLVCKRLKTPHRLALSGTPIQNDLRELWSIFDFVFPGRLGTLPAFETEFGTPIKRGGYSNASPMQVQLAYRCALILKDLINPYLLRRLKKDIKEVQRMPGKKEQVLFCRLTDQQRTIYEEFLRSDYVKKVFGGTAQLLGAITVMRKICNHPDLLRDPQDTSGEPFGDYEAIDFAEKKPKNHDNGSSDDEIDDARADLFQSMIQRSGKLEILAKILPLWKKQGHRVLIFCQWKKMLDIIMDFVQFKGWKFGRLDGNTNVASRQRLVDTFNADESYFGMLCTTRTGGVGLNLVGADRIILYDPDWNPQTDAQARERAWRFGQEREVTVYRMICAGTIEEKIYQRQIFKTALSNSVLQNSKQRRLFTHKDLKDLFSLKADTGSVAGGNDGMTETSELTKGEGYVDPDDEHFVTDDQQDDGETMKTVLKSKGLAGIFDHDVVEGKSKNKRASVKEMEEKAKKIAREALRNLQQSVAEERSLIDQESRFGGGSASSNNLLSSIAERNSDIRNAAALSSANESKQNVQLLKDLQEFVRSHTPSTSEILEDFSSQVSTLDAAVFRRLLKSIATLDNGRWSLK